MNSELESLVETERTEFRFMLELPNKMKIFSSDEELLTKIFEDCRIIHKKI